MPERVVLGIGATASATSADAARVYADIRRAEWIPVAVSTLDRKQHQVWEFASALGVPVMVWSAVELAAVEVPAPSERVFAGVGTSSVAEAAAILGSGGGDLVLGKTSGRGVTIAVAVSRAKACAVN